MKKFAMLLAAGVIALGASAQAADVESVTYAVITVPVAAGNNFIGVSVTPINNQNDTYATLLGIAGTDDVLVYNGVDYDATDAADVTATPGSAVIYNNMGAAKTIYEVGVAVSGTGVVPLDEGFTLVANPFAEAWNPDRTSLSTGSSSRFGAKANQIHIWDSTLNDGQGGWDTWWYKANTGWKSKANPTSTTLPIIGAAQAVLIQKGTGSEAPASVTFTAAQ